MVSVYCAVLEIIRLVVSLSVIMSTECSPVVHNPSINYATNPVCGPRSFFTLICTLFLMALQILTQLVPTVANGTP